MVAAVKLDDISSSHGFAFYRLSHYMIKSFECQECSLSQTIIHYITLSNQALILESDSFTLLPRIAKHNLFDIFNT